MTRTIEWWCCERTGEIEVPDDATTREINERVAEEIITLVSWGWSEKE